MSVTVPLEKPRYMKRWMVQTDPPKEASTFERVNYRSQLLFSNNMAHHFIECTTFSGLLKKINYTYKKLNVSKRSS